MFKKMLSMLLCSVLVLSVALTGCGEKEKEEKKPADSAASTGEASLATVNYDAEYFDGAEDGIIAEVNGEKVKEEEFKYFFMAAMMNDLNSGETPVENTKDYWTDEKLKEIMESAMNQCVLLHIYRTTAVAEGVELNDEDKKTLDSQMTEMAGYYGEDVYELMLQAEGMTKEMYKEFSTMSLYASKLYEKYSKDAVTDDEAKQHFFKNYVKAKHILILKTSEEGEDVSADAYTKIEDIKAQLDGGADFDALMKEHCEDPGVESNPEGYVFTKGEMVAEFEEAAFALEPGQMSDIITTDYGYHILLKVELTDADFAAETTDMYGNTSTYKDMARDALANDKYTAYLEGKKSEAKVKVNNTIYGKYKADAVTMYDEYYANGEKLYQQINELQQAATEEAAEAAPAE